MHRGASLWLPDPEEVVALHDELLSRTGGERGILSRSAVGAALARARRGHVGRPTSLEERAAFLLRGIAQEHPFTDGNKRTAFEVCDLFFRRNGRPLQAWQEEVAPFMVAVAEGMELEEMVEWLQSHAEKV